MYLRVLTVLAASTTGLVAASLIYYSFLQDSMAFRGGPNSILAGRLLSMVSIIWFGFVVYQLYLNQLPTLVTASIGMLITKLLWDIADGLRYAGRIYEALANLIDQPALAENFIKQAFDHRETQDLREVALTMFSPDSRQIAVLEELLTQHQD